MWLIECPRCLYEGRPVDFDMVVDTKMEYDYTCPECGTGCNEYLDDDVEFDSPSLPAFCWADAQPVYDWS